MYHSCAPAGVEHACVSKTSTMTATVKHLKQFEKIFLGIREHADEKLAELKSEFLEQQEWQRKAVVDTKESK